MRIIGVDCSTNDRSVAIAVGHFRDGDLLIDPPVVCGGTSGTVKEVLSDQIGGQRPCLLAIDAPLGWPSDLGPALSQHAAGVPLAVQANKLFRRNTDRFVKDRTGQQPLDVGADRIARTAYWALTLLGDLRRTTNADIPLVWAPSEAKDIGV